MSTNPKRQGMAIASFVLGILSMICFGLFAGIPAIILGHTAHRRTWKRPEEYAGTGFAIAGFVMGYTSIFTTLILAGMLLPALAKAKAKAQSITCVNHLKNVGLAFRIWATDHNDQFPFNATTNKLTGDVTALAANNADPIELRAFKMLSNELATPAILVCPADPSKRPGLNFQGLTMNNISYELESGPEVRESNPQEVLARCPIHGHELYCDGSVRQNRWR